MSDLVEKLAEEAMRVALHAIHKETGLLIDVHSNAADRIMQEIASWIRVKS